MVQTTYQEDMNVKFPGRYTVSGRGLRSAACGDTNNINFGRVVVYSDTTGDKVSLPYSNQAVLVLDADLVTSNTIAGNIIVNGTTTAISEAFDTNHLTTVQAVETALEAVSGVASVTISGANNRTLTVVADAETDIHLDSWSVTGGASQAGITLSNTCTSTIAGIAVHSQKEENSDGTVYYTYLEDTVPVLTDGQVDIVTDDALDVTDTVYFRFFEESGADEKRGMIGASDGLGADSGPTTSLALSGARPLDSVAAAGTSTIAYNREN